MKKLLILILKRIGLKLLAALITKLMNKYIKSKLNNMKTVEKSSFARMNNKDLIKGAIMALIAIVGAGLITVFQTLSETGEFDFTLKDGLKLLLMGVGAAVTYLLKNLFSNSEDKFFKKERKDKARG